MGQVLVDEDDLEAGADGQDPCAVQKQQVRKLRVRAHTAGQTGAQLGLLAALEYTVEVFSYGATPTAAGTQE
ncbi:hypothetical protein GCM10010339_73670 [Streptomyces alanosinicus]|uniref:Uncharacterized protein n=1 Tax=Streptomyces alanosinicus TaxID=68171 RepID=A0A918YQB4_9ACTN|nr:hypothetical protein GCM10010339_73670 [Streptomyces alanosinicus]